MKTSNANLIASLKNIFVKDVIFIASLILYFLFIWVRKLNWIDDYADVLPIIVALPVFFGLVKPCQLKPRFTSIPSFSQWIIAALFIVGIGIDSTIFLSASWCLLLYVWLGSRFHQPASNETKYLLIFPFLAFPWINLDLVQLGWWFRLSAATLIEIMFNWIDISSVRLHGTLINIEGIPISVAPACSGLNTLQSMLIAGMVLSFTMIGTKRFFWTNLLIIVFMAWMANTFRVLSICISAVTFSPEITEKFFHDYGGSIVLLIMFCLCGLVFYLERIILTRLEAVHSRGETVLT